MPAIDLIVSPAIRALFPVSAAPPSRPGSLGALTDLPEQGVTAPPFQIGTMTIVPAAPPAPEGPGIGMTIWSILSTASMAACAYHGYKRRQKLLPALGWAFCGAVFPVLAPAIAVAQGFGKPKVVSK